jgi:hypothetical protein
VRTQSLTTGAQGQQNQKGVNLSDQTAAPSGHPVSACAPRAPRACTRAPRGPGAGHGASGAA